ncbi:MAG: hypothetical protein COU47_04340 [Candidatus Niyogibacteria bacterium CG10_big_fil_rev_8_21_14_0_10_46_36]|uniref:Aminoglycoside phosphotransferase domain-containing protein n=1 Tax=Candidatus Niyogibacteria bacterium CG10_big_fil_rev_8_21_14_0_10_46_36 TaxID=1974726 RepID=A0A2H0TCL4_9BACT|nr:MAG: hypothetical protein COU47_04340 [Candidatus Niyogibacteria bacterium CG10_big_fil_rev_8_21_14_0_10_46_36]
MTYLVSTISKIEALCISIVRLVFTVPRVVPGDMFPAHISGYRLIRVCEPEKPTSVYAIALYRNAAGKEAFAKQWYGRTWCIARHLMKNEIHFYRAFHALSSEQKKRLKKQFGDIYIPKLIYAECTPARVLFLVEKAKGACIGVLSPQKRLDVLDKAMSYFAYVDHVMPRISKRVLIQRKRLYFFATFPMIATRALLRYPSFLFIMIRASASIIRHAAVLFVAPEYRLIHRDLNRDNVRYDGKRISVIDFQVSGITYPEFEIAHTIASYWREPLFVKRLLSGKAMRGIQKDKVHFLRFKAVSYWIALHWLSSRSRKEYKTARSYFLFVHDFSYERTK